MNRKFQIPVLLVLASVWLNGCMSEDSNSLAPSEIFIKYYGSDLEEQTIDLVELNDGFLLLGSRSDEDNSDFYLVRTDSAGNRLWEGTIGYESEGETESIDIPSKMYYDSNEDNLYIIGTSSFDRTDDNLDRIPIDHLFLASLKVTNSGFTISDTLIYRYYDDRNSTSPGYVPAFKPTAGVDVMAVDGGLIVLGSVTTGSNDPSLDDNSILLMRMSTDFETISWERIKGFSNDDYGKGLLAANGRYFYMASITTTAGVGNGGVDVLVEEFDVVSGNEDNQTEYGTANDDEAVNIIYTDPGIAIVGTTGTGSSQFAFLLRISSNLGNGEIVTLTYPRNSSDQNWNTQGADIAQTSNGDFFVVGQVNSFSDESSDPRENEIMLMPMNGLGEVYEGEVQEYGTVRNDAGNAIIRRADGSMIIGATVHFGGSATMMSLMKTNRNGEFLKN